MTCEIGAMSGSQFDAGQENDAGVAEHPQAMVQESRRLERPLCGGLFHLVVGYAVLSAKCESEKVDSGHFWGGFR